MIQLEVEFFGLFFFFFFLVFFSLFTYSSFDLPETVSIYARVTRVPPREQLLTRPRYDEHFGSFPENSLNGGVQFN